MDEGNETQQLGFVAGVVERERILGFERMLWRISRGNVFLRQADIEKPFTDPKTVRWKILSSLKLYLSSSSFPPFCSKNKLRVVRFIRMFLWHSFKVNN